MSNKENNGFYLTIRKKIRKYLKSDESKTNKFADYLWLVPDMFRLLCKLTVEKEVSIADKAKLAIAIAYFISPLDFIPEGLLGPIGYLDDLALAAYVLNSIINNTSPEVVKRHWAGKDDILEKIREILKLADNMLGTGLFGKIKKIFEK